MADHLDTFMTPREQVEIQAIARELRGWGLQRTATRLETLLGDPPDDERPCNVQSVDGVRAIPWGLAEILYPAYGHDQSLERMHERGGFGRRELGALAVDAYGSMGVSQERPGRLKRWPLLDLYDAAKRATPNQEDRPDA